MADTGIVGTELIKVLESLFHFVMRPIADVIAESAQRSGVAMSCRSQSLGVVACFGNTGLEVGCILRAGIAVESVLEVL